MHQVDDLPDDVLPLATRRVITALGLVAVVALLLFAALSFSSDPSAPTTPRACSAVGGTWEPDVIGHNGHCDR